MSKLKLVRKEKVKENSALADSFGVVCGNPECKRKIKITKGFTLDVIDASIKIGPCAKAIWICDACRSNGMLKAVRRVANEHILQQHMVKNFFPNL